MRFFSFFFCKPAYETDLYSISILLEVCHVQYALASHIFTVNININIRSIPLLNYFLISGEVLRNGAKIYGMHVMKCITDKLNIPITPVRSGVATSARRKVGLSKTESRRRARVKAYPRMLLRGAREKAAVVR